MKERDIKRTLSVCVRKKCEICEELATEQVTFLLPNARSNPASRGYGKDDISYCSDDKIFVCEEHEQDKFDIAEKKGMKWAGTFSFGERFGHLFLEWKTRETIINGIKQ